MGIDAVIYNKTKNVYIRCHVRRHSFYASPWANFLNWCTDGYYRDGWNSPQWVGDAVVLITDMDLAQDPDIWDGNDVTAQQLNAWRSLWLEDTYVDEEEKRFCEHMAMLR